jgi:hypothetical protein
MFNNPAYLISVLELKFGILSADYYHVWRQNLVLNPCKAFLNPLPQKERERKNLEQWKALRFAVEGNKERDFWLWCTSIPGSARSIQ